MTPCEALRDALVAGRGLDASMRTHTQQCATCAALLRIDAALSAKLQHDASDEEIPAALRHVLAHEGAPVAHFSLWRRAVPMLLIAFSLTLVMLSTHARADLVQRPIAGFVLTAFALVMAVVTSVLVTLHRGARGLGPPPLVRIATVALGVVAFEVLAAVSTHAVDGAASITGATHWAEMRACAAKGIVMALVVAVAMFASARRTAVTAPGASGAALGAAAGFAATLTLHVACASASHEHVALSHMVPVMVATALGASFGRRVLSV